MSLKFTSIEKIIETLLQKHECVILPEFGGFIVRDSPCNFNVAKDQIKPFARHIFFNPHLKENDGLLLNAIQKSENLAYTEAQSICRQAIEELKNNINSNGSQVFGILGTFFQGQENIWFAPSSSLNLSIDSYGLGPVDVKNLHGTEKSVIEVKHKVKKLESVEIIAEQADKKPIETTERKKTSAKAWVIAASVALLVHFVYLGIEYQSEAPHEASVFPELVNLEDSQPETSVTEVTEPMSLDSISFNENITAEPQETIEPAQTPLVEESKEEKVNIITPEKEPVAEIKPEEIIQPSLIQERVLVRYLMEANAHYHSADLNKTGRQTRVEKNGEWYEVRSSEPQVQ